jgi:hypothetical protein
VYDGCISICICYIFKKQSINNIMATRATEHYFTGTTTPYTAYDAAKTNLGQWIQQKNLGDDPGEKFAGPFPVAVARPMEATTAIPVAYPHIIDYGNGIHWVFLADQATAAATRRVVAYTWQCRSRCSGRGSR